MSGTLKANTRPQPCQLYIAQIAGQPSASRVRIDGYGSGTDWAEAQTMIAHKLNLPLVQCRFMHKGKILETCSGTLHQCRIQADDVVIVQQLSSGVPASSEALSGNTAQEEKSIAEALAVDDGRILVADFVCTSCQKRPKSKCYECGCAQCGVKDDSQDNIVCEECDLWYHWQCLDPPLVQLPEDSWYCPRCRNVHDTVILPGRKGMDSLSNKKVKSGKGGSGMGNVGHPKKCTIVPPNHRGPIPGIEVGQSWRYRACCGGDGVHRPPIAGIAGSASGGGAVSIVLSDGYPEDKDFGDTFTYTGSGGRDLSGKRVATQSFHQELTRENLALAMTCDAEPSEDGAVARDWRKSLGVRVIRSFKLKRMHPKFAPEDGYRYDGIYKLVKYGPGEGTFGFTVYRYEFRRDDAAPAPWTDAGKLRIQKLGLEMVVPEGYTPKPPKKATGGRTFGGNEAPKPTSEMPPTADGFSRGRKRSLGGNQRGQFKPDLEEFIIEITSERKIALLTFVTNQAKVVADTRMRSQWTSPYHTPAAAFLSRILRAVSLRQSAASRMLKNRPRQHDSKPSRRIFSSGGCQKSYAISSIKL
ncbi:hypothetical protein BP5796_03738 [Coleophoma crateriformis]|uniref:RING-type E3 ubiquitin transferase n=1 Tax=Coleophoma crateriformis TaxID=565419 RepID=A0A3D8SGK3_9HELO|nr:hypothetical protein BP5796_03738 [Coleophoma crateriformis]